MNRMCTPACLSGCSRRAFRKDGDRIGRRFLNTSKLTPIQPPPVTSPSSPHFVPKKMGQRTRLSAYYDDLIAPDYLLMNFDATMKRKQQLLPLRWDGTSPYHKNRKIPRQPPLPRLRQPVDAKNIPMVKGITVHTMVKSALIRRPDLLSAALVVQSLTGKRPEFIYSIHSVAAFKLRPRIPIAVKAQLKGPDMYSFLSLLGEVVFPRLKDFGGLHYVQSENNGTIDFGFPPESMPFFPQIEANHDSFSFMPGIDIFINTSATTTADARLLLSAFGFPFKQGPRHIPKPPVGGPDVLKKYLAKRG